MMGVFSIPLIVLGVCVLLGIFISFRVGLFYVGFVLYSIIKGLYRNRDIVFQFLVIILLSLIYYNVGDSVFYLIFIIVYALLLFIQIMYRVKR